MIPADSQPGMSPPKVTPTLLDGREAELTPTAQTIRLLLVEDQVDYALLMQRVLARARGACFEVRHAARLDEALRLLEEESFDSIVLDLTLPDSAGLDTLEAVCGVASECPIVVLSGIEDEAIALRAVQAGAQDYLVKDNRSGDLLERAILYAVGRKRAQEALLEEQRLLLTLMENVPDSIYFKDRVSRFTRINRGLAIHLGLSDPAEAVGKSDFDYFSREHAEQAYADERQVIGTGVPIVGKEEKETWPDGHENWVSTTKMPLRDRQGRIVGTFGISRDITERKRAEAEIQKLNERLEQRVAERTEQLYAANRELENEIQERRRTEDELRASNERFSALFESALEAILIVDDEGRYVDANPAACEIFGRPRDELIGLGIIDVVVPEQRRMRREIWERMKREGEVQGQFRVLRPDGETRDVELNAKANFVTGRHLSVLRDVTERSRTEEERTRRLAREQHQALQLRRLARAALSINAALSRQGLLQVITEQARELIGAQMAVTNLAPSGNGDRRANVPSRAEKYAAWADERLARTCRVVYEQILRAGGPVRLSEEEAAADPTLAVEADAADGGPPMRGLLAAPLFGRDGRILGTIYLTDKQEGDFEDEDEAMLVQLAQVAAIAVENSRLYREAQDSVRAREEVLTIVSHDLKNPLGVILGHAQLLRRRAAQDESAESKMLTRTLLQIEAAARRMDKQIAELLDFARLQVGQPLDLNREPVDLYALVTRLTAEYARAGERHVIRVDSELGELLGLWDAGRLERVVDNLLSNAVKYSPKGGDIVVGIDQQREPSGSWAVLSVSDQGLGIPAADLPRIFERFHRAGNVAGWIAGTGIGLSSTRHIVEQHGGEISVTSEEGAGSTFTVRLPLAPG